VAIQLGLRRGLTYPNQLGYGFFKALIIHGDFQYFRHIVRFRQGWNVSDLT
jgi:hypothetical protein